MSSARERSEGRQVVVRKLAALYSKPTDPELDGARHA